MSLTKSKYDEKIIKISHAKRKNGRASIKELRTVTQDNFKKKESVVEMVGDTADLYKSNHGKDIKMYKIL